MSTRIYRSPSGKTVLLPMCKADLSDGLYCRLALGHDGDHNPNPRWREVCTTCSGHGRVVVAKGWGDRLCPDCGGEGRR